MDIYLYKTSDENNKVNKTLTDAKSYTCVARGSIDVLAPEIMIEEAQNISTYNYCYIPELRRYFFITDISYARNNLPIIRCRVDVLMTYKAGLLEESCVVARQENEGNLYIVDRCFPIENRNEIFFKEFPNGFDRTYSYYMVTGV